MATIVYSRDKKDPEQIYLPLQHGGFVMLVEGSHKYEEHAGYGLKNSENPTVQHYLATGKVNVILDGDTNNSTIVLNSGFREFAPLNTSDYGGISTPKIAYPPLNDSAKVEVATPEETTETTTRVSRRVPKEQ